MPLVSNSRSMFLNDDEAQAPRVIASGFGGWTGVAGSTALSISVWFKTDPERKTTGTICAWGNDDISGNGIAVCHLFSDEPHFVMGGGEFRRWKVAGSGILDERWHHFVFTCPVGGNPSNVKFYRNGSLVAADATVGTTAKNTATSSFFRAGVDTKGSFHINAHLDELAIWGAELAAGEITAIYNGGLANFDLTTNSGGYVSAASGELWWRFEDPTTDQVIDSFGHGNSRKGFLPNLFTTTVYRTDVPT